VYKFVGYNQLLWEIGTSRKCVELAGKQHKGEGGTDKGAEPTKEGRDRNSGKGF